jgi:hypothetical protein
VPGSREHVRQEALQRGAGFGVATERRENLRRRGFEVLTVDTPGGLDQLIDPANPFRSRSALHDAGPAERGHQSIGVRHGNSVAASSKADLPAPDGPWTTRWPPEPQAARARS